MRVTAPTLAAPFGGRSHVAIDALGTGLWAFIGVPSTLFALFLTAYGMRMQSGGDWARLAMPWQLWLSSGLLLLVSVLLERCAGLARGGRQAAALALLRSAGVGACAFIAVQLWGWQALQEARVVVAGNPAASFFYLLTAMHGLHALGGIAAWGVTLRHAGQGDAAHLARSVALLARYWHFLLALWAVLFAALGWLTPEIVA